MTDPLEIIHVCSCGTEHTRASWQALPFVGTVSEGFTCLHETRNCPCGSTQTIPRWLARGDRYERIRERAAHAGISWRFKFLPIDVADRIWALRVGWDRAFRREPLPGRVVAR